MAPSAGPSMHRLTRSCDGRGADVPRPLLDQLKTGGGWWVPLAVRTPRCWSTLEDEQGIREESLGDCRFVKLIGRHGWDDSAVRRSLSGSSSRSFRGARLTPPPSARTRHLPRRPARREPLPYWQGLRRRHHELADLNGIDRLPRGSKSARESSSPEASRTFPSRSLPRGPAEERPPEPAELAEATRASAVSLADASRAQSFAVRARGSAFSAAWTSRPRRDRRSTRRATDASFTVIRSRVWEHRDRLPRPWADHGLRDNSRNEVREGQWYGRGRRCRSSGTRPHHRPKPPLRGAQPERRPQSLYYLPPVRPG